MKKLALVALVLAAAGGSAQANVRVFGSYWDGGDLEEGYGGGAGARFECLSWLGLDLRGSYLQLESDLDVSLIPIEAAVILQCPLSVVVPYAGLGGGYYLFDSSPVEIEDQAGFFGLLGLEVGARKGLRVFGEVRWVMLESRLEDTSAIAEDLEDDELTVDGLGVNVGLVWDW